MILIKNKLTSNEVLQLTKIEKDLFLPNNYSEEEIKKMNESNNYKFIVMLEDDVIVGYSIILLDANLCEIYKIGVIKTKQHLGYGSKILNTIKTLSNTVVIEVSDRDNTYMFYQKNKFFPIHFRKNYYYDNSNAIIMQFNKE